MFKLCQKNIYKRIRSQGILKTLYYTIFVLILPELNINIKKVYGKKSADINNIFCSDNELAVDIINKYDQLSVCDKNELVEFEGNELLKKMNYEFSCGNTCVLGRNRSGILTGLCWLEDISGEDLNNKVYLIRDAFVFPKFRGKNYFPALIAASYLHAINMNHNRETLVVGNVIFGNYSSSQGFLKAKFYHLGISITLFGRQIINKAFCNK